MSSKITNTNQNEDEISNEEKQLSLSYDNSLFFSPISDNLVKEKVLYEETQISKKVNIEGKHNDDNTKIPEHVAIRSTYITSNIWPPKRDGGKMIKKKSSRTSIHGVEMRYLPDSHFLAGQVGLFAAKTFSSFDILGEYCGEVLEEGIGGVYVACLEDKGLTVLCLGLDAQNYGNECRAINHYSNITDEPNVAMKICYVEELPRVMIVVLKKIDVAEEILLDYGNAYVKKHFLGVETVDKQVENVEWGVLPGADNSGSWSESGAD